MCVCVRVCVFWMSLVGRKKIIFHLLNIVL